MARIAWCARSSTSNRRTPPAIASARSSAKLISFSRPLTNNGGAKPPAALLESLPIRIDDLLANGQGVGRVEKLVTFVTGALPGEQVRVAVDAVKPNYVSTHA